MKRTLGDMNYYTALYASMEVLPSWADKIAPNVNKILSGATRYRAVEAAVKVPWVFMGLIHKMEADCAFGFQLLNGQRWDRETTMAPKGQGPWASWEASAVFAMRHWKIDQITDWSIERVLLECEKWNGAGYLKRGLNSPYLWSGTKHGVGVGKYGSDGHYSGKLISGQLGVAPMLRELITRKQWDPPANA